MGNGKSDADKALLCLMQSARWQFGIIFVLQHVQHSKISITSVQIPLDAWHLRLQSASRMAGLSDALLHTLDGTIEDDVEWRKRLRIQGGRVQH